MEENSETTDLTSYTQPSYSTLKEQSQPDINSDSFNNFIESIEKLLNKPNKEATVTKIKPQPLTMQIITQNSPNHFRGSSFGIEDPEVIHSTSNIASNADDQKVKDLLGFTDKSTGKQNRAAQRK